MQNQTFILSPTGGQIEDYSKVASALSGATRNLVQTKLPGAYSHSGTGAFVVAKEKEGVTSYIVCGSKKSVRAVTSTCELIGARCEVTDGIDLSRPHYAHAYTPARKGAMSANPQGGVDFAAMISAIAPALDEGDWVAFSFRAPRPFETTLRDRWEANFIGHRQKSALDTSRTNFMVTVYAGGYGSTEDLKNLCTQVISSLPGFSFRVEAKRPARVSYWWVPFVASLAWIAGIPSLNYLFSLLSFPYRLGADLKIQILCAVLSGLALLLAYFGFLPTHLSRIKRCAARGFLPRPPYRTPPLIKPKGDTTMEEGENGMMVQARDSSLLNAYPFRKRTLMLTCAQMCQLIVPPKGSKAKGSKTAERAVPEVLKNPANGFMAGISEDGNPIYLSSDDMQGGLALLGDAGSGKSELLRQYYAHLLSKNDGRTTIIIFEPKLNDGARILYLLAKNAGWDVSYIAPTFPNAEQIDFFAGASDSYERANQMVEALTYAMDEGSIGARNGADIRAALALGFETKPEDIEAANKSLEFKISAYKSAIDCAGILTCQGEGGQVAAKALFEALKERLSRSPENRGLERAVKAMSELFDLRGNAFLERANSAGTKITALIPLAHAFYPGKNAMTFKKAVDKPRVLVIYTGPGLAGGTGTDSNSKLITSMGAFCLRSFIAANLSGYGDSVGGVKQGKVYLLADELSLLAGSDPALITWFKDQGRSYGVSVAYATQQAEQLPERVRTSFFGLTTLVAFRTTNSAVAENLAEQFALESDPWIKDDFKLLGRHQCAVKTTLHRDPLPSFTMRTQKLELPSE